MNNEVISWIKRHRLLRTFVRAESFELKKRKILDIFHQALRGRNIPATPYVYNSHQADIRQIPELKAVICDVNFLDIAKLVASSYYVSPTHDIVRLADALLANSLLCHNKIILSLRFAHKFIRSPYSAVYNALSNSAFINRINSSVQYQTAFALLHEIAHFECNDPSCLRARFLKQKLNDLVDSHNQIAEYINRLDLTAIAPYLDKIKVNMAFAFPAPPNYTEIIEDCVYQMHMVLIEHGHLVQTPQLSKEEREHVLVWACENYLRGQKAKLLDKDVLVTEGTCDLLALLELMDFRIPGINKVETLKLIIDAYTLSLLTLDLIQGAMNVLEYTKGNGYDYVDMIYMRREKEMKLLPLMIILYSHSHGDYLSNDEIIMLCEHFSDAARICDMMYAEFCEYVFSIEFEETTFIPHGSPEWIEIYTEINRILQYPV